MNIVDGHGDNDTPPPTHIREQAGVWSDPVITLTRAAARIEAAGGPIHVVRQLRQAASRCEMHGFTTETGAAYDEAMSWAICHIDDLTERLGGVA